MGIHAHAWEGAWGGRGKGFGGCLVRLGPAAPAHRVVGRVCRGCAACKAAGERPGSDCLSAARSLLLQLSVDRDVMQEPSGVLLRLLTAFRQVV